MGLAACLLPFSFAVAVFAPDALARLTRAGVAPRLGVAAWLATIGSVVGSWVAASVFLAGDLLAEWEHPGRVIGTCFATLRQVAAGNSGSLAQAGLLALTAAAIAALSALGWRLGSGVRRTRTRTHHHAREARIAGRRVPGLGTSGDPETVVLDAPERAAYSVAGRPGTIVVTTSAVAALDGRRLSAVLAHERAHLDGRHHHILALTRALAAALPRMRLFTAGAAEIARLLEMCADDTAARGHGRHTLLAALLALTGCTPVPYTALGAAGVDVLARAQRLAAPATAAARWHTRLLLTATTLLALGGPLLTVALASTGWAMCNPLAR